MTDCPSPAPFFLSLPPCVCSACLLSGGSITALPEGCSPDTVGRPSFVDTASQVSLRASQLSSSSLTDHSPLCWGVTVTELGIDGPIWNVNALSLGSPYLPLHVCVFHVGRGEHLFFVSKPLLLCPTLKLWDVVLGPGTGQLPPSEMVEKGHFPEGQDQRKL